MINKTEETYENFIKFNYMNILNSYKKSKILIVALICLFNSTIILGQERNTISDFYEYANREWLDSTIIPSNASVVNNWGILWNEIIDKSIEILSGDVQYVLDENHQYILVQLQKFYRSATENTPNERKRVYLIQKHYPMLFGVIFSKITIPSDKEEKIKEVIKYVRLAYKEKIENSSKIKNGSIDFFLSRLNNMQFEIGAPEISRLPQMPELSANSLETNIQLTKEYQLRIGSVKPKWVSPPYETDCRYRTSENIVRMYAGTIYAISFSIEHDYPVIFATLGRTIAHEMTHAFDTYKKNFIKNEWKNNTQSLISQFNQYEIQNAYFVDGKKTLQENYADLGGLEVSLLALKLFIKENHPSYSEEENLTAIRSYFMSFAQFWKEKATPEFEMSSLKRIHTPQKFRAIGPIYNQNDFYKIYEIDIKSKYYIPENQRISIW